MGLYRWVISYPLIYYQLHVADEPKATVCFFFVSRYMDEKNQWGSEIKKTKNFKKNTLSSSDSFTSQLHPATAALPGCPYDQSPSQRCIIWHFAIDVAPVLGQLTEKNVKFFSFTSPLSSANLYLRITFDKAKILHDCSFCMQPKGKGKTKTTLCVTNRALSQTHGCAKWCILCFFSRVFFFSRVGKNQWVRVTRNKEKTRRGLNRRW